MTIKIVSGTPADARARCGELDCTEHTDSILAGYGFLSWRVPDQLYEDPVVSYEAGSYHWLRGDELAPSIQRMSTFLTNFSSFPFAQSVRLRLATELAITGRTAEARAELRRISGTPQEPRVRDDARRLDALLGARDGGSPGGPSRPSP